LILLIDGIEFFSLNILNINKADTKLRVEIKFVEIFSPNKPINNTPVIYIPKDAPRIFIEYTKERDFILFVSSEFSSSDNRENDSTRRGNVIPIAMQGIAKISMDINVVVCPSPFSIEVVNKVFTIGFVAYPKIATKLSRTKNNKIRFFHLLFANGDVIADPIPKPTMNAETIAT